MPNAVPEETMSQPPAKEETLLEWAAPSRPFKRRSRDFYTTLIAIAALLGVILFLIEGFMPVLLIISLLFLFYVLSTIEPETITYKITSFGIRVEQSLTPWDMMGRFWFTKRFGSELLIIEVFRLPGRIELVIDPAVKPKITSVISKHLTHEEIPPSLMDKFSLRLSKLLPE